MIYLKTLQYSSKPDYAYLDTLFSSLFVKTGGMVGVFCVMYNFLGTPTTPFDWETPESALIAVELERKVC